jgi:hypothetical protein
LGGRGLGLMGGRWIGRRCFFLEAFFQSALNEEGLFSLGWWGYTGLMGALVGAPRLADCDQAWCLVGVSVLL